MTSRRRPPNRRKKSLHSSGRTVEDLDAAVRRLKDRRAARTALDKARALPAEQARVAAALQAADDKFRQAIERAEAERAAAVGPLLERRQALERLAADGQRAEQQLRDSADPPPELADLRKQLTEIQQQRDKIIWQSNKLRQAAGAALQAGAAEGYSEAYRAKHRQEAAAKRAAAEQLERDAAPFQEEVRRLQIKIAEVEDLALTP